MANNLPTEFATWDSWSDFVLARMIRMVQKQDYWWEYFDPDKYDAEQIELALFHARIKLND